MTNREFLRLHLEAVWETTIPPLDDADVDLPPSDSLPPWLMYWARLGDDQVTLWRADVAPEQRADLLERARRTEAIYDPTLEMRREVALRLSAAPAAPHSPLPAARRLTADDAPLLEAFEAESAPYFLDPGHAPCIGVIVDGRLASVAHSSRRTPAACELGINTLPEARRRGYALVAILAWTRAIRAEGLTPIYSAFAHNTASLRLAAAAGYIPVADGIYGPMSAPNVA
ncbi:MAG TPA: GNAT family N-acetyltransferase [Ktedonobacterales bacterium]|jgi:RimJ/RimL family protein N-acetyltransferase|nr:GNAT family N-acetyltransferase [Ktedonobacterales bacterium]